MKTRVKQPLIHQIYYSRYFALVVFEIGTAKLQLVIDIVEYSFRQMTPIIFFPDELYPNAESSVPPNPLYLLTHPNILNYPPNFHCPAQYKGCATLLYDLFNRKTSARRWIIDFPPADSDNRYWYKFGKKCRYSCCHSLASETLP